MLDTPSRDRGPASQQTFVGKPPLARPSILQEPSGCGGSAHQSLLRLRYVPPGAAALLDLTPVDCRWPIGAVEEPGFRFCAARRGRGAYCTLHARQARR